MACCCAKAPSLAGGSSVATISPAISNASSAGAGLGAKRHMMPPNSTTSTRLAMIAM